MPKQLFTCSHCNAQFSHWQGRCEECGKWNTLEKAEIETENSAYFVSNKSQKSKSANISNTRLLTIENLQYNQKDKGQIRIQSHIAEFDKVLGGGIVPGSLILLGGEPGIGKSTLILQVAAKIASQSQNSQYDEKKSNNKVLYISAEESRDQVALRSSRLKIKTQGIGFIAETNLEQILAVILKEKPILAIIDSIQTIYSNEGAGTSGSLSQVKLCADKLMVLAKEKKISIILIGHVTKEGVVAGPKTLEHLVDTVLYLEGENMAELRILRTVKNRFGSTGEAGVFQMQESGFLEVKNPSAQFLSERNQDAVGSAVSCILEGRTPFLIEVQALSQRTVFGYPERKTHGFPLSRLNILIAVINRHLKIKLLNQDIYVNLVGGLKSSEPSLDLAVIMAIISIYKNKPLPRDLVILGEVGLSGEVRKVKDAEKRIKEAERLGFKKILGDFNGLKTQSKINLISLQSLEEAMEQMLVK